MNVFRYTLISLFILASTAMIGAATIETSKIAFLAVEPGLETMAPHNRAAWEAAQALGDATLLTDDGAGGFADNSGVLCPLADFDVVWHHQGDSVARTSLHGGPGLAALKQFAQNGGGVLLSGGAVGMMDYLGLEPHVRSQRHDLEQYRDPAFLVPKMPSHPAFAGLQVKNGSIGISNGGCPAVADFYWGGPAEAMVLGNTPAGVERPLVEYAVGSGRMIFFGWRWPDYADLKNPYRDNLLRLTGNLLSYLADPEAWRPIVIPSKFPAAAYPDEPGIAVPRWRALRLAIEDLMKTFQADYPRGGVFLAQLDELQAEHDRIPRDAGAEGFAPVIARFDALQREALLANPLLDFEKLLVIRRSANALGLPMNYHGNTDITPTVYGNTLETFSPRTRDGQTDVLFTPEGDRFVGDLDLHYDGDRLLLSVPDAQGRWGIAEFDLAAKTLTSLPLIDEPDVHNYDACYLPDDRIVFTSTAPFIGVPCVGGRSKVANLYLRETDGRIRRLTNDQDHNWCPTVLNNGRLLYLRWEYADIAHAFTRLLFHANPDGSEQLEYYGSNSYWPASLFYARAVPGHPTKVIAVAGGHHDAPRQGELVLLDPARGRNEADGVVQRIPGYGEKVEPVVLDGLVSATWPRFLHPYPLSEKYFLVSCKPTKEGLWGVYLADVFDNFVLLREEPGWALLEPTPWRKTPRPPVLPDKTDPEQKEATVMLTDVYRGPGLTGVPRGTVKFLRLVGYTYTFHDLGCEPDRVGLDGPWDVKRIIGTVPVEDDGSASFRVPACTPIAVQPLDAEGKAVALMRSWLTTVPGEMLSCTGCHEQQNTSGEFDGARKAFRRAPSPITPWYGPARGFSFEREVQPVLDAWCTGCHDGKPFNDGRANFDLTARPAERVPSAFQMHFSPSYMELRRWVHTPTLESDAHLLPPRDFHADTSTLVQLLRDGHYGVTLSAEAWDRILTWIDLNAPFHGTWQEVVASDPVKRAAALHGAERRRTLHARYAGIDEDQETIHPAAVLVAPTELPKRESVTPLTFEEGMQGSVPAPPDPLPVTQVDLGDGIVMELVRIEAGQFVMGSDTGYPNERPARTQTIAEALLMGRCEVTNRQFRCFDPDHDSGLETGEAYQFGDDERGHTLNRPEQPVVRVSWDEAEAFCAWLSEKTGRRFMLPTEAQWEYACRAGTMTALWYGTLDSDFSACANFSDATHHTVYYPHVPDALPPWRPADTRFDDRWRVAAPAGSFAPNSWGLHDMHGNVAEWAASPYGEGTRKVVRGGSWMDCPVRGRSAFRTHYEASQAVHDVGFRVVCAP